MDPAGSRRSTSLRRSDTRWRADRPPRLGGARGRIGGPSSHLLSSTSGSQLVGDSERDSPASSEEQGIKGRGGAERVTACPKSGVFVPTPRSRGRKVVTGVVRVRVITQKANRRLPPRRGGSDGQRPSLSRIVAIPRFLFRCYPRLERLPTHPDDRLGDLLPDRWIALNPLAQLEVAS